VTDPDDLELLRRLRDGDDAAFDAIVDRHERRVFAVALRICRHPEDARDVTQEVFLTALRSLRSFRGDARLSTWLHRVAVNAALDAVRRRARRRTVGLEEVTERPSDAPGPEEEAAEAARAAAVRRAVERLPPDHRAVVVLHDLEGLDYAECAAALGVPVGTVKSRLHRARLQLARDLGHLRPTEPAGDDAALR
jgi:RNA polymerase sigma-70 factor (ECF subfamily)